ncbi:hypothetical protein D3C81_1196170 [compost metagenome]
MRKITAPITSCSKRPACPVRGINNSPSTTVSVRAPNSHQKISSTVATRLCETSSGHGAVCNGLMPALISTQLNNRNTASLAAMRQGLCADGIARHSSKSSTNKATPITKG